MLKSFIKYFLCFLLIFCAFFCSKISLFVVSCGFILIAITEYRRIFLKKDIFILKYIPEILCCALTYVFVAQTADFYKISTAFLLFAFIIIFLTVILKNQKPYIETAFSTFCLIFFVFSGLFTIKIFDIQMPYMLIAYFGSILLSDFSASIIGAKVKKRILIAKEISPNKTLAGLLAHIATSCIILTAMSGLIGLTKVQALTLGVLLSLSSQCGDLSISCIKRCCNVKHSSLLFGEYGGILDRMDAFIFSAPVTYCFLIFCSHFHF